MFENLGEDTVYTKEDIKGAKKVLFSMSKSFLTNQKVRGTLDAQQDQMALRYSTAINLCKLKDRKVLLIGAGGIGAPLAKSLVALGVERLMVIDDDEVELKNVGTQGYELGQVGMFKVNALQETILLQRGVLIDTTVLRVESGELALVELLTGYDIIIVAPDNQTLRRFVAMHLMRAAISESVPSRNLPTWYIQLHQNIEQFQAFMIPMQLLSRLRSNNQSEVHRYLDTFEKLALFKDEEVTEVLSCTERFISYGGLALASYVTSFVHWANDEGDIYLRKDENWRKFFKAEQRDSKMPFRWKKIFNTSTFSEYRPPKIIKIEPIIPKAHFDGREYTLLLGDVVDVREHGSHYVTITEDMTMFNPSDIICVKRGDITLGENQVMMAGDRALMKTTKLKDIVVKNIQDEGTFNFDYKIEDIESIRRVGYHLDKGALPFNNFLLLRKDLVLLKQNAEGVILEASNSEYVTAEGGNMYTADDILDVIREDAVIHCAHLIEAGVQVFIGPNETYQTIDSVMIPAGGAEPEVRIGREWYKLSRITGVYTGGVASERHDTAQSTPSTGISDTGGIPDGTELGGIPGYSVRHTSPASIDTADFGVRTGDTDGV